MEKSVLITGSTGFIGRNLKEQLKDKYNLFTPNHSELELTDSKTVKNYFDNNQIDVVIHCATAGRGFKRGRIGVENPQSEIVKQNLQMFFNIVNNLQDKKLINFGSGAEYDKRFDIKMIKETNFEQYLPTEDYAFSKYIISKYLENSNKNIINLRFFAVYGKYEDYKSKFISNAICRNLLGLPIIINQNAKFDYLYIDDAVKIIDYFVQNEVSEKIYNVGSGKPIELLALAQKINKITNKPSEIILKCHGLNKEYSCDVAKLLDEIKDFKFTNIDEGIKKLYNYYKLNLGALTFPETL